MVIDLWFENSVSVYLGLVKMKKKNTMQVLAQHWIFPFAVLPCSPAISFSLFNDFMQGLECLGVFQEASK